MTGTGDAGTSHDVTERDRALAWELYRAQPGHPRIEEIVGRALARDPHDTDLTILLGWHLVDRDRLDEARSVLQEAMARRDGEYVRVLRALLAVETQSGRRADALWLATEVLRADPDADWSDHMAFGGALAAAVDGPAGWTRIDEAASRCADRAADELPSALERRAHLLLETGAPPARFAPAAEAAVTANPDDADLATALAYARLWEVRPVEAEALLARVLRSDPTDEFAEQGIVFARSILRTLDEGRVTLEEARHGGLGEIAWRLLRDGWFGIGLDEALEALDDVMPAELERSLLPPNVQAAEDGGYQSRLQAWHDGQRHGTGGTWGTGEAFRLLSLAEVDELDEAVERDPDAWPQWVEDDPDVREYAVALFTDDDGSYLIEGPGGRVYRRPPSGPDVEIAESQADWIWDRVVAFGGRDPRPARAPLPPVG